MIEASELCRVYSMHKAQLRLKYNFTYVENSPFINA